MRAFSRDRQCSCSITGDRARVGSLFRDHGYGILVATVCGGECCRDGVKEAACMKYDAGRRGHSGRRAARVCRTHVIVNRASSQARLLAEFGRAGSSISSNDQMMLNRVHRCVCPPRLDTYSTATVILSSARPPLFPLRSLPQSLLMWLGSARGRTSVSCATRS